MSKFLSLIDPLRENQSSHQFAVDICELIKDILRKTKSSNVDDLKKELRNAGKKIMKVHPLQFTVENVIRRVCSIIDESKDENLKLKKMAKLSSMNKKIQQRKDETDQYVNFGTQQDQNSQQNDLSLNKQESSSSDLTILSKSTSQYMPSQKEQFNLEKIGYIEDVEFLMNELTTDLNQSIDTYAPQHITSNEVIMTYECSKTVEKFLLRARREKREFEVIILVKENNSEGEEFAQVLSNAGIVVSIAPYSSAYAFMSRVNKIYIGVHAIMKNGGILANAGSLMLATAAKTYRVDFIVLGSTIKLTPHFPFEQNTYNELLNPKDILPEQDKLENPVSIIAAKYDYLAPEYITLYITNLGEHSPAYVYRLFNDFY